MKDIRIRKKSLPGFTLKRRSIRRRVIGHSHGAKQTYNIFSTSSRSPEGAIGMVVVNDTI